jgi:hypothetical protein
MHRLEAEAIHDAILSASGELDQAIGGTAGVAREKDGRELRRALYLLQKRDNFPPMEALFDGPPATESCARRHVSTVALQPLYLLNSEFLLERARAFAARVGARAGGGIAREIEDGFLLALGRPPDETERADALRFFQTASEPEKSLLHFCHALLNLNEFVYLE